MATKKKVKTKKHKPGTPMLKLVNFKANRTERERMQINANKRTKGNLSDWLRIAALDPNAGKSKIKSAA